MRMIDFLGGRRFLVVNRDMAVKLGAETALLLGELADTYTALRDAGKLPKDGFFPMTMDHVRASIGLSGYLQRIGMEALQEKGLVTVTFRGAPPKRFVRLNGRKLRSVVWNEPSRAEQEEKGKDPQEEEETIYSNFNHAPAIEGTDYL